MWSKERPTKYGWFWVIMSALQSPTIKWFEGVDELDPHCWKYGPEIYQPFFDMKELTKKGD